MRDTGTAEISCASFTFCFVLFDFLSINFFVKMSQSLEMRAAIRTNGEALKRYIDFEQMQRAFISYKNKVYSASAS